MIPHPGEIALFIALVAAFVMAVFLWLPGRPAQNPERLQHKLGWIVFLATTMAFLSLTYAYIVSDFSLENVASHSHSTKPLFYKISGVWGNHEGSLLLWVWMLTGLGLWGGRYAGRVLPHAASLYWVILGTMQWAFLVFTLFASNPFARSLPAPSEGQGLNPILQDVALAIHPPLLYLGYVGFGVVFVLALALLLRGSFTKQDAYHLKRWVLLSLGVLTWGIMLGSWWAYRELGWGGYWFWDPVENASLLPWLAGAALAHTLWTVEKRNLMQGWALLLAFIACILSLLGTFLVRSGVLTSVHAFASDPDRGIYLLIFLGAAAIAGFGAYALRGHDVARTGTFAFVSKENALVWNNILLSMLLCAVMMGTLYPLLMEVLSLPSISVGEPYFRQTALPVAVAAVVLAALAPHIRWRQDALARLMKRGWNSVIMLGLPLLVTLAVGMTALHPTSLALLGTYAGTLLIISAAARLWNMAGRHTNRLGLLFSLRQIPARGLDLAHLGFAVLTLGASLHAAYATSHDAMLEKGGATSVAGYDVRYRTFDSGKGADFIAFVGRFDVTGPSDRSREILVEKRYYPIQQMSTTEATTLGIFPVGHLYLAIGEVSENGAIALRLYYNPWVSLVWLGGLLMGLGSVLAALRKNPHTDQVPT